jgi:hypothetical protein
LLAKKEMSAQRGKKALPKGAVSRVCMEGVLLGCGYVMLGVFMQGMWYNLKRLVKTSEDF